MLNGLCDSIGLPWTQCATTKVCGNSPTTGSDVRRTKHRREALNDTLPGVAAGQNKGTGGKGTGKDKNGDPQVCFAWRDTGVCARKDAGTCIYAHPMNMKNIGKPVGDKGKGKDGKRSSSTQSRSGKGGNGQGQPGTPRGGKQLPIQNCSATITL